MKRLLALFYKYVSRTLLHKNEEVESKSESKIPIFLLSDKPLCLFSFLEWEPVVKRRRRS